MKSLLAAIMLCAGSIMLSGCIVVGAAAAGGAAVGYGINHFSKNPSDHSRQSQPNMSRYHEPSS